MNKCFSLYLSLASFLGQQPCRTALQDGTWKEEKIMGMFYSSTLELWLELSEKRGDVLSTFAENSGGSDTVWAQRS